MIVVATTLFCSRDNSQEWTGDRALTRALRAGLGLAPTSANERRAARWSSITVPTLLMQGADTWEPMPSTMNALAAALPAAGRVSWPGQSHFATITAPDLVAGALREFFAEAATRPC